MKLNLQSVLLTSHEKVAPAPKNAVMKSLVKHAAAQVAFLLKVPPVIVPSFLIVTRVETGPPG